MDEQAKYSNKPIFLRTEDGLFVPYIMHIGEVAGQITLVVLSKGKHSVISDLLFKSLRTLQHLSDLVVSLETSVEQEMHKSQSQWSSEHIAVRGASEEAFSVTVINGNYLPMAETVNDRPAYERTAKDAYLFYDTASESWIIAPELGRASEWSARIVSHAPLPDLALHEARARAKAEWEEDMGDVGSSGAMDSAGSNYGGVTLQLAMESAGWQVRTQQHEAVIDDGLELRCVRGDGAMRNTQGRFASLSANSLYYCGGVSACRCGSCDNRCGPDVGCNCDSCRYLSEVGGFGNMELVARYRRSLSASRLTREERVKAIRKQIGVVEAALKKMLECKSSFTSTSLKRRLSRSRGYLRDLAKGVRKCSELLSGTCA